MPASHSVEKTAEGKVRIRDLELFMGFDPSIDSDEDETMQQYDNRKVASIAKRTNQFIARGSRPKLVIEHEKEGKEAVPAAVGDITTVRYEDRNGVGYIVGDVEMSQPMFDKLLGNNAFPRRSAEIWKDDHLSEVALLGRDTPRRPLPDTKFGKNGNKVVFERPMGSLRVSLDNKVQNAETGVGGGSNTFVPTAGTQRNPMARKQMKKQMEAEDEKKQNEALCAAPDEAEEMAGPEMTMEAEGSGLEDMMDASAVAMASDSDIEEDEMSSDDDEMFEEEDEDEMDAEAAAGGKMPFKSAYSKGSKMNKELFARVRELEAQNARYERQLRLERFAREVDGMIREGYRCGKFRNSMVEELADAKNPVAKMSFWKATMSRDPIGVPTIAQFTMTDDGDGMSEREAYERAMREAGNDSGKYRQLFAKYTGKKA